MYNAITKFAQVGMLATIIALIHGAGAGATDSIAITGTVTNQSGIGVSNVSVSATAPGGTTDEFGPVTTASDGSYTLFVNLGSYDFHFVPPSGSNLIPVVDSNVSVLGNQTINIQLTPAAATHTFSGTLTDQNGNPITCGQVSLTSSSNQGSGGLDSNGHFSFSVLGDIYTNIAVSFGSPCGFIVYPVSSQSQIDLTSNDVSQNLQVNLVSLTVVVKDSNGNLISGASIKGQAMSGETTAPILVGSSTSATIGSSTSINSSTNTNGTYTILVPMNIAYQSQTGLCAYNTFGQSACLTSPLTVSQQTTITLTLPAVTPHTFSGSLTDQNGNPISCGQVTISANDGNQGSGSIDSSGHFSFQVPADTYTSVGVSAGLPCGFVAYSFSSPSQIDLTTSDVTQNLQITLEALTVVVKDSNGNPLQGVSVKGQAMGGYTNPLLVGSSTSAYINSTTAFSGGTDANGTYTMLVPLGVEYIAQQGGICAYPSVGQSVCLSAPLTVSQPTSVTLTIPVISTHTFSGTLTDQNGNPLRCGQVSISSGSGNMGSSGVDTNGHFSFTVPADIYTDVSVRFGSPCGSVVYSLDSASQLDLTSSDVIQNLKVSLETLTVLAKDPNGNPLSGVALIGQAMAGGTTDPLLSGSSTPANVDGSTLFRGSTDANGIFTMLVTLNITYPTQGICATMPNGQNVCLSAPLTVSQPTTLILQQALTPPTLGTPSWTTNPMTTMQSTTVTVSVTAGTNPVAGGEYYLRTTDPGQGKGTAMTLSGGNLSTSFSNMAAGIYTINFRAKDSAGNWSPVTTDYLVVYNAVQSSANGHSNKIMPVYGTDLLPGLTSSGQTDAASMAFTVKYNNGTLDTSSKVHFAYNTGANCNNPNKSTNCHTTTLDSSSIDWMIINGTNNSLATIQGTATVVIDGVTSINPFRVIVTDGALLNPAKSDQYQIQIFAPNSNPNSAQPIYYMNEPLANGNVIVKG